MKNLFIQKNIVILIILIFIFSSIAGASQVYSEKNNNYFYSQKYEFDETFLDISGNSPPETPDITGPKTGKPGVEYNYTITSTDPDENDIVYCFSWGDDTGEVCIGPYQSGEEVTISHIWLENGTYTISVKAADILGAESEYATLTVKISMSRSFAYYRNIIYEIFQVLKKIKSDILIFK
ncbi:MAG: PKD domain-containing protein [Thermoplasmatales archaeon]|nr:MAG: PKD domain-containing protein [Thermoplasmatales archaeon]